MSYLSHLGLFGYSSIQHILCCVFCLICLCLVYPMLPVSLGYPFIDCPSVFSNVYLQLFTDIYNCQTKSIRCTDILAVDSCNLHV